MAIKRLASFLILFFVLSVVAVAQATENERKYTAFDMRSNGKIYVVVAVMLIIMLGLILYMVRIDRRITRLESKKDSKEN
jgi:uncharacterized membrane protein